MGIEATVQEWVLVGRIVGVHGVRGEIVVRTLTPDPSRLRELPRLHTTLSMQQDGEGLQAPDGHLAVEPEAREVQGVRFHKGRALVRLSGVPDRTSAQALVGRGLAIPLDQRASLPKGQYYVDALVGLTAVEDGREVGRVEAVEEIPGNPLLAVATQDLGEVLVPLADAFVERVEVAGGRLWLRPAWRALARLDQDGTGR